MKAVEVTELAGTGPAVADLLPLLVACRVVAGAEEGVPLAGSTGKGLAGWLDLVPPRYASLLEQIWAGDETACEPAALRCVELVRNVEEFPIWRTRQMGGWLDAAPADRGALPALAAELAHHRRHIQWRRDFGDVLAAAKAAGMRELAYGAGHEINNPLTNIAMRAQTLLRDESDPRRIKLLEAINRQAFRAFDMIADMMLYAKPPVMEPEMLDLVALVREVVDQQHQVARDQQTELTSRGWGCPIWIQADSAQLAVALTSLVRNALEACARGGRVVVEVATPAPSQVEVWVTDSGPGLSATARQHLFDPFYSGREAGRGLGFGLCKAQRIAEMHQARVEVLKSTPQGTRIGLRGLMRVDASAAVAEELRVMPRRA